MIAVVDYGVGNLFSLSSSLNFLGLENQITSSKKEIENADRIILPGVGAFGDARKKLAENGLDEILLAEVKKGKPLFGICLGMQMLFERSYEYGLHEGLGLIKGDIAPLEGDVKGGLKIPHMGWNSLQFLREDDLFKYVNAGDYVYFVHSYYAKNCLADTVAVCDYSIPVTAAVRKDNVMGTQFHPEKSGAVGLDILKAFGELK